ncbi:chemerin-like receptor 1 [Phyllobates terribilis]|uniref:chemerin-like receptor 1 n=1 Tax=Phyllobates terribilis TaxID=111132 RepID=UPI003CCAB9ED
MNNSFINGSYNDQDNSIKYTDLQIFRIVVHVMVYILGITGNGVVIWFCIFRMEKTVNVVWILNLAITDFTFTFFLPLRITYLALDNHWLFGNFMCKLFWLVYYLNLSVSVFQLMVISVDRYICVYFPVWCQNHRRSRLAVIIAILLWFIAIPFNVQQLLIRNIEKDQNKKGCRYSLPDNYKWKAIVNPTFLFFLPFTIIVLCYVAITVRIKRRGIVKSSRPFKIFLTIIILFFLCFFPYNLFFVLQHYGPPQFSKVNANRKQIVKNLMIANSCINPILYILFGQNFKEKIFVSLHAVFHKAFIGDEEKEDSKMQKRVEAGDVNSCVVFEADSTG